MEGNSFYGISFLFQETYHFWSQNELNVRPVITIINSFCNFAKPLTQSQVTTVKFIDPLSEMSRRFLPAL